MSLAVEVPIGRFSFRLAAWRALAGGLIAAGCLVSGVYGSRALDWIPFVDRSATDWPVCIAAIVGLIAGAVCTGLRERRRVALAQTQACLQIDAEGRLSWQLGPTSSPVALEATSWFTGGGLLSIRCRYAGGVANTGLVMPGAGAAVSADPVDGRKLNLLLARDGMSAGQWRGVRAWLVWRQRGGHPGHPL